MSRRVLDTLDDEAAFARLVSPFKNELKAHCYRMSGSLHDAEDLLQDSLLRAWKGREAFEGRSSVRTWLFKIATNTCLNALEAKKVRVLPMDLGPAGEPGDPMTPQPELGWLDPCPPELYGHASDPEASYRGKESVALAFMAALQLLPARQRALLILNEVLGWGAAECAESLGMTAAAVNSALQRARATLAERGEAWRTIPSEPEEGVRKLLQRYLRAWESADVPGLVSLLHEDATLSMPPIPVWLRGAVSVGASLEAMVFSASSAGEFRMMQTEASGCPALAVYRLGAGQYRPYALQLIEVKGKKISGVTAFLDTSLFTSFGLPAIRGEG